MIRGMSVERANAFALAVAVLRDFVGLLPMEDQNDLLELLPAILAGDEEERASAQKAVQELFDQAPRTLHRMDLATEPGPVIQEWMALVGGRIREARAAAKLTQQELAERSGLPQSHISRLERGLHSPSGRTLERIATALGVPVSSFDRPARQSSSETRGRQRKGA